MKIKADWTEWLHNYRKRELDIIFSRCPYKVFKTALEIGAGDGFQSRVLGSYAFKLICTDINANRLKWQDEENIEYKICDAEKLNKAFSRNQFDLIFSSNLLEHLPEPNKALSGVRQILKDDGITIHILPSPFWKLSQLLLHMPNLLAIALEKRFQIKKVNQGGENIEQRHKEEFFDNNPKIQKTKKSLIYRLFLPLTHGVSSGHIKEFYAFSKRRWKKEFDNAGFNLIKVMKGPVASGYGFGFGLTRRLLEIMGFASEYIYISVKKGKDSHYKKYFGFGGSGSPKLVYIVSQFPETHETFILREIKALEEKGVGIKILSLKPCRDKVIHPEAKEFIKDTVYGRLSVLSIVYWVLRRPIKTISALLYVLKTYCKSPKNLVKALYVFFECLYFINIIKKEKITHIHSHWATMPTTAAMILTKLTGIPFSFTAHAWDIFVNCDGLEEKIKKAKFVVTCTDYNRRFLSYLCQDGQYKKIYLNYHGIDLNKFKVQSSKFKVTMQNSKLSILSIGRLVETKGFEYLIEACRILKDRGVDFECKIVGIGPLEKKLKLSVVSSQLSAQIQFLGIKTQEEIKRLYSEATVLVQPSVMAKNGDRDGIPNVILEAMAMGTPVISTDFSGISEAVIDKKTGVLIPERDAQTLAEAIEKLYNNLHLRQTLAINARKLVEEKFGTHENIDDLVSIFQINGIILAETQYSVRNTLYEKRSLNVLYIIWSLGLGGAERVVINLVKGLDKVKFNPVVCCLNDKGVFAQELEKEGIKVIALGKKRKIDLSIISKLTRVIKENNIQIVHTHLWGANFWGRIAGAMCRVKVVVTEHNTDVWKSWFHLLCDRILSRFMSVMITVSNEAKYFYIQKAGVRPDKIMVIHNGIDISKFSRIQRNNATDSQFRIGIIGRIVEQKGHKYFLEAIKLLQGRYPFVKGVIVGSGSLEGKMRALTEEMGLGKNIEFLGFRNDISSILPTLDILAMPSLREGLPIIALEAMAAGVPVVSTAVGGSKEVIIDKETGFLTQPRKPQEMAEIVAKLIDNNELRAQIAEKAEKRVRECFSIKHMVDAHQEAYEAILRPKVLYIIDTLALGGAQRQLIELLKGKEQLGIEAQVCSLSSDRNELLPEVEKLGIKVYTIHQKGKFSPRVLIKLYSLIRKNKYDIVNTYLFTADFYGRLAAKLAGVPVVISSTRSTDLFKKKHYVLADRILTRCTDKFIANAYAVKDILVKRERISPDKVEVVYNGIDTSQFIFNGKDKAFYKKTIGLDENNYVISVIGRLSKEKDHITFLKAARRIKDAFSNISFLVVGTGEQEEALKNLTIELGIKENVIFMGLKSNINQILAATDILIMSSLYEGCSNVIIEALACGVPVIATRVGGNPELIIDGENGFLTEVGDDEQIANFSKRLLIDKHLRKNMGRRAINHIESYFSREKLWERTREVYNQALAKIKKI